MHYVRLLRNPSISPSPSPRQPPSLKLVFTIATDLGDAYLYPEQPIPLSALVLPHPAHNSAAVGATPAATFALPPWKPGLRVIKTEISAPQLRGPVRICIGPAKRAVAALDAREFLGSAEGRELGTGRIMPAWADILPGREDDDNVLFRRLDFAGSPGRMIELEEEIGESIARHVWDGGLAAVGLVACLRDDWNGKPLILPSGETIHPPRINTLETIIRRETPLNILELGCGVGVLGTAVATLLLDREYTSSSPAKTHASRVVMTDVDEAEERAQSNVRRFESLSATKTSKRAPVQLQYENLDWHEGKTGVFGPLTRSCAWDLVIVSDCTYNTDTLAALVGTMSALHDAARESGREGPVVFLATKPRHESERAFFDMMREARWVVREKDVTYVPVLDREDKTVEFYAFERE